MNRKDALPIAERLIDLLSDRCERIELAGSVRREKPEVGDIELVAVPKIDPIADLFGKHVRDINWLDSFPWELIGAPVKNGPRYKQIALHENINLDLFMVLSPAQWGVIFTIRTGPADFSKWIVTQRKKGGCLPSNCFVQDGAVFRGDSEAIPMPEEIDFLDFLGIGWIEPWERQPRWRIRA